MGGGEFEIAGAPQCASCGRWIGRSGGRRRCGAFPDGIPEAIWGNAADHRLAFHGDNGLRWTPARDGARHPYEEAREKLAAFDAARAGRPGAR